MNAALSAPDVRRRINRTRTISDRAGHLVGRGLSFRPATLKLFARLHHVLVTDSSLAGRTLATRVHSLDHNQSLLRSIQVATDAGLLEYINHTIRQATPEYTIEPLVHNRRDGSRPRQRL